LKYRDEKELVQKCIEGSPAAWEEFVDRYGRYIYSVVFKTLQASRWHFKPEDSDDIVSRVFVSFLENNRQLFRNFEWRCSLKTWIWIVTRKMVIRYFRKKQHTVLSLGDMGAGEGGEGLLVEDPGLGPDEEAQRSEKHALLRSHLAQLPERERLALKYYFFEGASYVEIAGLLNVKPHYVGTIIFRAKKLLEGHLSGKLDREE
jgi:RNA polymerase sigma-70 factor (ECF subfamily)